MVPYPKRFFFFQVFDFFEGFKKHSTIHFWDKHVPELAYNNINVINRYY